MNILKLFWKVLIFGMISYVDDPENGGGSSDDGGSDDGGKSENGNGGAENGASDEGGSDNAGKSESENKDTPENSRKRWLISKKKEAEKNINTENNQKTDKDLDDKEFQKYINEMINEGVNKKMADYKGGQDNSQVDALRDRMDKEDFFKDLNDVSKKYSDYGFEVDNQKIGEMISDIEEKGFTPEQLIHLFNMGNIESKLKMLPKQSMETENGQKTNIDNSKMSAVDKLNSIMGRYNMNFKK